jgi:hypothetical protein
MTPNTHQLGDAKPPFAPPPITPKPGMLQEVFNLDERPVTLIFPSSLSEDSYQDLSDRIEIVLRGLKRRSAVRRSTLEDASKRPDPADHNAGQIPFMITQAQKEALRKKGFEDDQIAHMTPEKAHQLLGIVPPPPY